jgi:hypothetical protein
VGRGIGDYKAVVGTARHEPLANANFGNGWLLLCRSCRAAVFAKHAAAFLSPTVIYVTSLKYADITQTVSYHHGIPWRLRTCAHRVYQAPSLGKEPGDEANSECYCKVNSQREWTSKDFTHTLNVTFILHQLSMHTHM